MQTTRANSLDEIYLTLNPDPLETQEEIDAFYRKELNEVRGDDKVERLQLCLERDFKRGRFFKGSLIGHPGVGKSTELTRLIQNVENEFLAIRFDVRTALNPVDVNPLDILLVMMSEVMEKTKIVVEGESGSKQPSEQILQELWNWFATEKKTNLAIGEGAISSSAGVDTKESLWNKVIGLFVSLKGEIKYSSTQKKEVIEYSLVRIDDLMKVFNRLLDECNQCLQDAKRRTWLFIGEDFDKTGISTQVLESLFIDYGNIFKELKMHLIFNLPISLYSSSKSGQLPFEKFLIPDTPVFQQNHAINEQGRKALRAILNARLDTDLFELQAMERLIVASGGNLRDLFSMTNYAADTAILRKSDNGKISNEDVTIAIENLRTDYQNRLGFNPYDDNEIIYEDKAKKLEELYKGSEAAQIPDLTLYTLLANRAVQEFNKENGKRWFGVHPLVVDLLNAQGRIQGGSQGGISGGTT